MLILVSGARATADEGAPGTLEWVLAQLSPEERAALVQGYAEVAEPERWRELRDRSFDAATDDERRVLLPAIAKVTLSPVDVHWLKSATLSMPAEQRQRWAREEGPIREAFFRHLRRELISSDPARAKDGLRLAVELELHRGHLADLVGSAVRDSKSPETRAMLFDYLERWRPSRYALYLEAIAAAEIDVSTRAQRELARLDPRGAPLVPDVVTRGEMGPTLARAGEESDSRRSEHGSDEASALVGADPSTESDSVPAPKGAPNVENDLAGAVADADATRGGPAQAPSTGPALETRSTDPPEPLSGRWPLILYTAGAGALSFGTIGDIAFDNDTAVAASALIGGTLGGAIPYLLTLERDISLGDAAFMGSQATWSALAGYQAAGLLDLDRRLEQPRAEDSVAILTGLPALIVSSLYYDEADWSLADAGRVNALGVQVGLAAHSAMTLAASGDPSEPDRSSSRLARSSLLAYGLGFLPASLWAADLELDREDRELIAYGTGLGAALGTGFSLSSPAEISRSRKAALGAVGGQAVGFVGAMALSPAVEEFRALDTTLLTALGASTAMGLAAVTPSSPEPRYERLGLLLNGGALAFLGAGIVFPHVLDWGGEKKSLTTSFGAVGAALGASLPLTDEDLGDDAAQRIAGGAALGAGLGVLGGALLAPVVDGSRDSVRGGLGMTFYGTGLGTGLALSLCGTSCTSNGIRGGQIGALSAIAGAAWLSDRFPTDRRSLSVGAAGSLWSAWNAGLLAEIVDPRLDTRDAGLITAAGAAGGALFTVLAEPLALDFEALALFDVYWGARNLWGYSAARAFEVDGARERVSMVAAAPLLGLGMAAAMNEVVDLEETRPWHFAATGAVGALNAGLLLERERIWGAAFGALTGASLTPLSSAWLDDGELGESLLWSGFGNAMGLAIGGLSNSSRTTAAGIGGLAGFGAGGLLAPVTEIGNDGRWLLGSAATLGAAHAALAAGTEERGDWALISAGAGVAYATLDTLWRETPGKVDLTESLVLTALGDLAGWGIAETRGEDPGLYVLAGGLGSFVLGHQLSPYTEHDARSAFWSASVGGTAAAAAYLAARDRDRGEDRGWSATAGALGAMGALGVSQLYRPEIDESVEAMLWGGVGLGTASLLPERTYSRGAGLLIGTLGGSIVAPFTEYSADDALLIGATTAVGAALGAYSPDIAGGGLGVERAEAIGLGATVGLVAGAAASQWLEVEPRRIGDLGLSLAYSGLLADSVVTLGPTDGWSSRAQDRARLAGMVGIMGGRMLLDDYIAFDEWQTPGALTLVGASLGTWTWAAVDRGELRHGLQLGIGVGLGVSALVSAHLPGNGIDRIELVAGSAIGQGLGYGLGGDGNREASAALAGLGGAGLAAWLAPRTEYDRNDAFYTLSLAGVGAGYGSWAAGLVDVDRTAGAAASGAVALAYGAAASQWLELSRSDLLETGVFAGLAHGLGHEIAWAAGADRETQQWVSLAAGSTFAIGWPWLAGGVTIETHDVGLGAVGAGLGAWAGYQLSSVFAARDQDGTSRSVALWAGLGVASGLTLSTTLQLDGPRARGAALGTSVGIATGYAAGQLASVEDRPEAAALSSMALGALGGVAGAVFYPRLDRADLSRGALGFLDAGAFGAGVGLIADEDSRWAPGALQLAGLAGAGLAIAYGERWELDGSEQAYVGLGTALLGGNGFWAATLRDSSDRRRAGAALLGASLGGGASLAITQRTELGVGEVVEVAAVTGLGQLFAHEVAWSFGASPSERQWAGIAVGSASWLLWPFVAEETELSATDVGLAATAATLGGWTGFQLSSAVLELDGPSQARGAALGAGMGLAFGFGLAQQLELDRAAVRYAATGAGIGVAAGYAAGQLALPEDRARVTAFSSIGLGLGGALFAARFGDALTVDRSDAGLVAIMGSIGAWHGAWASQLFASEVYFSSNERRRAAAGGAAAGAVLGTVAGAWFAQDLDYDRWDLVRTSLGWGASATLGGGVGLLVSDDDRWAVGLMHGAGIAGGLALAHYAPRMDFEGEELLVGSLAMSHMVWQGVGISQLLDLEPREFAGTMMVATAGGGLLGAALGKRLQLDTAETWASFSGELWGSWLGAWIGYLYADEFSDGSRDNTDLVIGVSAVAANVGLLSSSLAVTGWDSMTPARMGWVNLFGAAGALVGAAGGSLVKARNNVQKGNVVGTVLGLGTGVVVTGITGWGQGAPSPERAPATAARSRGWLPKLEAVMPQFSSLPNTDPDWLPENAEGFYLGVEGQWR